MNENTVPAEFRDINIITAEIRVIKREAQAMALNYAVEIGRRLTEAKEMLKHGEWGEWLTKEADISPRSATNFMRLYEEYGDDQNCLFGAELNRHARADLPIRKALQLLAVPAEEREEFIEKNDVENKSTRELEQLIRERDTLNKAKAEAEQALRRAEEKAKTAEAEAEELKKQLEAVPDSSAMERQIEELEKSSKAAKDKLKQANDKAKAAAEELEKQKKNPQIPPDKLREIQTEAAKNATAEYAEKIKTAEERAKKAETAAEELRKKLAQSDAEVSVFKTHFEAVQQDFDKLTRSLERVQSTSPETAKKLTSAVKALADNFSRRAAAYDKV